MGQMKFAWGGHNAAATEKKLKNGRQPELGLLWGVAEMQGWRPSMEDACVAMGSLSDGQGAWGDTGLFGVFDGHGGAEVATFCAKHLPQIIRNGHASKAPAALHESFMCVDRMLTDVGKKMRPTETGHPDNVGCTAVACLVSPDSIIVANAGDSRAVLSRNGRAVDLSQDHKPNLEMEAARIHKAGGFVSEQQCGPHTIHRVNGGLSLSRAIGDLHFKKNTNIGVAEQLISCVPDTETSKRCPEDEFMVIACDGVWDVLSSQELVNRVRRDLPAIRRGSLQPSDVVAKILDECLAPDPSSTFGIGADNMTMILVVFDSEDRGQVRTDGARLPSSRTFDGKTDTLSAMSMELLTIKSGLPRPGSRLAFAAPGRQAAHFLAFAPQLA